MDSQKGIALLLLGGAALLLGFLYFRSDSPVDAAPKWNNTTEHYLTNEDIRINLPIRFKESSRYRIKEDMPILKQDSTRLRYLQDELMALEFEDRDIDVYVDTMIEYRFIVILNKEKIYFDKSDAKMLKRVVINNNHKLNQNNPSILFGEVDAGMSAYGNLRMARYTTPVMNNVDNSLLYHTTYFVTGRRGTLVVYEFSQDATRIENYLWSCTI